MALAAGRGRCTTTHAGRVGPGHRRSAGSRHRLVLRSAHESRCRSAACCCCFSPSPSRSPWSAGCGRRSSEPSCRASCSTGFHPAVRNAHDRGGGRTSWPSSSSSWSRPPSRASWTWPRAQRQQASRARAEAATCPPSPSGVLSGGTRAWPAARPASCDLRPHVGDAPRASAAVRLGRRSLVRLATVLTSRAPATGRRPCADDWSSCHGRPLAADDQRVITRLRRRVGFSSNVERLAALRRRPTGSRTGTPCGPRCSRPSRTTCAHRWRGSRRPSRRCARTTSTGRPRTRPRSSRPSRSPRTGWTPWWGTCST